MQRMLQHENIPECLCTFIHKNNIWVVMPLMAYGKSMFPVLLSSTRSCNASYVSLRLFLLTFLWTTFY